MAKPYNTTSDPFYTEVDRDETKARTTADSCRRRTWSELHQCVKETSRLNSSLTTKVPNSFNFRQQEGQLKRLYFLGMPVRDSTLMYVDVTGDGTDLRWKQLVVSSDSASISLSKEEQLRLERKRTMIVGLTSYIAHTKSGLISFYDSSKLCLLQDSLSNEALSVRSLETTSVGAKISPSFCDRNPALLAYVCNGDLWMFDHERIIDIRLTYTKPDPRNPESSAIGAGCPSFIIEEEFERYTGYWWQPNPEDDNIERILYEEVDETNVDVLQVISSTNIQSSDKYRYPRAGRTNAISTLRIAEIQTNTSTVVTRSLHTDLKILFPELEYLVRVCWHPSGQYVCAQLLNRPQNHLSVVMIPLEYFVYPDYPTEAPPPRLPFIIRQEVSDIWVNVHNILLFLDDDPSTSFRFVWSSEKTGYRHLYLCSYKPPDNTTMESSSDQNVFGGEQQDMPLTFGEWVVKADQKVSYDASRRLLYFLANRETPLEDHLYSVSLDDGLIQHLTPSGKSTDQIFMDDSCKYVIITQSSIDTSSNTSLYRINHHNGTVSLFLVNCILQADLDPAFIPPQLFQCPIDNGRHNMYGMVYRPHHHVPGQKHPTVLFIYGGPHAQLVTNSNRSIRNTRLHTMASLGYTVVLMDSRGSANRGLSWESYLKGRMGTVEIADQVEGLQWLASKTDYIDLARVALYGWSYGGYLSLMGLVQQPDVFRAAVSGAPVTHWESYDTGYTERYMSEPSLNSIGYQKGSVLNYVESFPDQENRLLLIHGMVDENVFFVHTTTLMNSLIKACKPFRVQVYPEERHGIRNQEASQHFETSVLSFLQDALL